MCINGDDLSLHTLDATFFTVSYVQKNKAAETEKILNLPLSFIGKMYFFLMQI